ncbi:hypothetical protein CA51_41360 [Rosistilla oblonga]|uniref:hypothetical protein n=1 Tax=Rosistilla oblonga TaxID=2527990 RepID=UPI001188D804|nr:hypothetical protein [Rosistilla oblonga]QDV14239.1 hypothetical protein CA51_41360 [Rosistilla oblonga]
MTKYLALLALLLTSATANAAAVFPSIDGGAFNAVQNNLTFTVSGTYADAVGAGAGTFGTDDTLNLKYDLTGNSGGPVLDFTIEFSGVIGAAIVGGYTFSSTLITLDGPMGNELNLTPVESIVTVPDLAGTFSMLLGMSATTISPLITPGSINFLPVPYASFTGSPGTPVRSGLFDFSLISAGANGTGLGLGGTVVAGSASGIVNPIPEPASMLTLLGCVGGACAMGRRRRKAARAA